MHFSFSSRCSLGLRLAALVLLGLCALSPQAAHAQQTLYVSNGGGSFISKITPAGVVSQFATGLSGPVGLAFDSAGNLYVANSGANTIVKITPAGGVSTYASGLNSPVGLAFDSSGNLYAANAGNDSISKITPAGVVSTFASGLSGPQGLVFDSTGNLYVANSNGNSIAKITPAGVVSTYATGLNVPLGLAFDSAGNLYAANFGDGTIAKITPAGVVSTFASGFIGPRGLAFDTSGNLYAVNGNTISKITPAGVVSTFAGPTGLNRPQFLAFAASPPPPPTAHTYVSHAGTDTGNCSRSAPCATFAYALTQTLPGGTVTAVNAGEYGPMTITQAVTVDGEGTQAGITAPGGGSFGPQGFTPGGVGVTVKAGATDVVTLRGLSIVGQTGNGFNGAGIQLNTGSLVVDDCHISGIQGSGAPGISLVGPGTCLVENTTLANCFVGLFENSAGAVSLRHVTLQGCGFGLDVFAAGARADVEDSQITQNVAVGLRASNGATISASGCTLSGNGTAVQSGNNSIIRLTNNDIYNNQTALNANGGIIATTGNNRRAGNANATNPPATSDQPNKGITVQ